MKKIILASSLAIGTLFSGVGLPINAALAASMTCGTAFRLDATNRGILPNMGCEVGSFSQDSPQNVNTDAFFGRNDWNLLAKSDEPSGIPFFNPGEGGSGTFDFSGLGIDFSTYNVLVTFKAANEFPIVGYLATQASGTWLSPFTDFNSQGRPRVRDVSHISVFQSPRAVPTPALLPGLIGMGVAALRKRQKGENAA